MDKIELYETPSNNHGCRGYSVTVQVITNRFGIVIDGLSCSSCWQVGHDDASSPIRIGMLVELPDWFMSTWHFAAEPSGYSHNELIDDWDDPHPDCTAVCPSDLIRYEVVPQIDIAYRLRYKEATFAELKAAF